MELDRLPRGQAQRAVAALQRHLFGGQPLRRRQDAARHPHPRHEAECLLHPLPAAFGAQVAVVLLIDAMEFRQLRVVVGQRSGFDTAQPVGDRAAQQIAAFLDALVGGERPFECPSLGSLIHVAQIAAVATDRVEFGLCRGLILMSLISQDPQQRRVHVLRHARWRHHRRRARRRPSARRKGRGERSHSVCCT